jgi:hypothetical protein
VLHRPFPRAVRMRRIRSLCVSRSAAMAALLRPPAGCALEPRRISSGQSLTQSFSREFAAHRTLWTRNLDELVNRPHTTLSCPLSRRASRGRGLRARVSHGARR